MRRAEALAIIGVVCAGCGQLLPDCPTPDAGGSDTGPDSSPSVDASTENAVDAPGDGPASDVGDEDAFTSACPPRVHSGSKAVAYQIDIAHTGSQSADTLTLPLCKRWTATLAGKATHPLIANGVVYVASINSSGAATLYAFDIDTGQSVWGPIVVGSTNVGLAYDDGKLFALVEGPMAVAYDAATGQTLWVTALGQLFGGPRSGPTASNGIDFFSDGISTLFALDESTGSVLWNQYELTAGGSPSIVGSTCFDTAGETNAYAFDAADGGSLWNYPQGIDGAGYTSPVYDGALYDRSDTQNGGVVLDTATGKSIGTFASKTIPAFGGSFVLYVNSGVLSAVDLGSNTTLWTYGSSVSIAPITVGPQVVVGTSSGDVVVLDQSGSVVSSDKAGAPIAGNDAIGMAAADGVLAVPASNTLVVY